MSYVAYYRVSTDRQGKSGLGLDAQRKAVADHLNGAGYDLVAEFTEVESGKRDDRPELAKALARCRKTKATLVIAKLDRLARNVHFISGLMDAGVEFVAVDLPGANRLTLHIMAAMAEHEREMISRRTREGLQAAKRRGRKLGWAIPDRKSEQRRASRLGVTANTTTADQHAANTIPIIDTIRAAGVTSLAGIAEALNARGIATARGGRWHASTVRNVLARADKLDTRDAA